MSHPYLWTLTGSVHATQTSNGQHLQLSAWELFDVAGGCSAYTHGRPEVPGNECPQKNPSANDERSWSSYCPSNMAVLRHRLHCFPVPPSPEGLSAICLQLFTCSMIHFYCLLSFPCLTASFLCWCFLRLSPKTTTCPQIFVSGQASGEDTAPSELCSNPFSREPSPLSSLAGCFPPLPMAWGTLLEDHGAHIACQWSVSTSGIGFLLRCNELPHRGLKQHPSLISQFCRSEVQA